MTPSTVLVVDDDEFNLKLLGYMLGDVGYAVRTATGGVDAIKSIAESRPDLILLDVMMPGMDGFEALRRIKADPATNPIPVVLLTALSDPESRQVGLQLGAAHFLTKPGKRADVIPIVSGLLKRDTPQ